MFSFPLRYQEPLFRPPSEAQSLILQLTIGCSWNRCTYCGMYRMKQFRVRPLSEVVAELESVAPLVSGVRRVFLADGDALAAPFDLLEELLVEVHRTLPSVQRVGVYGDSRSILKKGVPELKRLRELGLGIVYFGAESGDPSTLHSIRKGATVERQLEACRTLHQAGLKSSVMVLLGLAGVAGSERHASATGSFLAAASPTFSAALTVTPVPGTEMYDAVSKAELELPDRWGMLQELLWMLAAMKGCRTVFHANHASNYLPLKLRLPRDREATLELLHEVLKRRDEGLLRPEWARGL